MTSEILDGLLLIAIISVTTVVFVPLLFWILPPRGQVEG